MPAQLWETTMDPEQRLLKQLVVEDAAEASVVFSSLMGTRVSYILHTNVQVANYNKLEPASSFWTSWKELLMNYYHCLFFYQNWTWDLSVLETVKGSVLNAEEIKKPYNISKQW